MKERLRVDLKSLLVVTGKSSDFAQLAQDCACFAHGAGGQILIGAEDAAEAPSADQRLSSGPGRAVRATLPQ